MANIRNNIQLGTTTFIYITNTLINQSTINQSINQSINTYINFLSFPLVHLENTIYLMVTQKFFVAKNM